MLIRTNIPDRDDLLPTPRNDRKPAAGRAINGIADYASKRAAEQEYT